MRAVILVGGEGTRLRPLTYRAPKQMLPIVGVPMLERVLANLAHHGVTEAVLSLGYLPDRFIAAYPDNVVAGVHVTYAVEPEPLDTAGAIRFAALHAGINETFIVVNGDVLTDLDVTRLVDFHRAQGAQATIALHPVDDPSRFGVVPTHPDGRVIAFVEKPSREDAPTNQINAGTYVLEPSVLNEIAEGVRVSVERVTFPKLVEQGTLYALSDDSYWLDTGTPQAYLDAHRDILDGTRPVPLETPVADFAWVHPTARVGASTLSFATVDRDCVVGDNVTIENSVLLPGAIIEDGAAVIDSIVGPTAVIGRGAILNATCVIGGGVQVPGGSVMRGEVRLGGPQ